MTTRDEETRETHPPPTVADDPPTLWLTVTAARGLSTHRLPTRGEMLVGRDLDCDVQLADIKVSRHHFVLRVHANGLQLTDLASTNGTAVGNRSVDAGSPVAIRPGDVILVGTTALVVEQERDDVEDEPLSASSPHPLGAPPVQSAGVRNVVGAMTESSLRAAPPVEDHRRDNGTPPPPPLQVPVGESTPPETDRSGTQPHLATLDALGAHSERERILQALNRCAGNQTMAARILGISRRTLVARLTEYAVPRPRKR